MNKISSLNEKGYTLVEVLAVIVILGVIASIGLLSISNLIDDSKDKSFVNNALAVVHATNLYLNNEKVVDRNSLDKITYAELYHLHYINEFHDPYTGIALIPSDATYVELIDGEISKVCLDGENRNFCSEIDNISVDLIQIKNN